MQRAIETAQDTRSALVEGWERLNGKWNDAQAQIFHDQFYEPILRALSEFIDAAQHVEEAMRDFEYLVVQED